MKIQNTKNKKIILALTSAAFIFGATGSALAFSSDTLAYGHGGYGQGCRGDATCRAERQANQNMEKYNLPNRERGMQKQRTEQNTGQKYGQMRGQMGGGQHGNEEARTTEINKIKNSPLLPISEEDKDTLIYMREEEKLARDVYLILYEKWGANIFNNISKSEQRHMDMVKVLLDKYNLTDPITNDSIGVFTDENLQKLYNDLVAQGSDSLVDALRVGATIEDVDIYDLENAMSETENADIIEVYTKLRNGSENHMRAFHRELQANGVGYEAQYISSDRLEEILAGENKNKMAHDNKLNMTNRTNTQNGFANWFGGMQMQEQQSSSIFSRLFGWLKFWTW